MSSTITLLFIGDIMGTPGMDSPGAFLPALVRQTGAECIIANGENAMDGKSISESQVQRLKDLGVGAL